MRYVRTYLRHYILSTGCCKERRYGRKRTEETTVSSALNSLCKGRRGLHRCRRRAPPDDLRRNASANPFLLRGFLSCACLRRASHSDEFYATRSFIRLVTYVNETVIYLGVPRVRERRAADDDVICAALETSTYTTARQIETMRVL